MNICLVTTFFPPASFGGDGVFVRRLARALASRGNRVTVVHEPAAYRLLGGRRQPGNDGLEGCDGISVQPLEDGARGRIDLVVSHQLGRPVLRRKALRRRLEGPFDVIHFHNISLVGGPGVVHMGHAVKLLTLHDYWTVCAMHVLWRYGREACTRRTCLRCSLAGHRPPQLWRATDRLASVARAVDAFIAPSAFARDKHLEHGFPAPIRVLPHFVRAPEEPVGDAPLVSPYFLYVGRLERLKGVDELVAFFRTYDRADLVIAGAGALEDELRSVTAHHPHIHVLGWTDRDELDRWYRDAIAVLLPSRCYETFGLTPIEAFVHGTPAVVRGGGAADELVADGGGLVYRDDAELRSALDTLLGDPTRRAELGAEALRLYQVLYTEEAHMTTYLDWIGELRDARGAGR